MSDASGSYSFDNPFEGLSAPSGNAKKLNDNIGGTPAPKKVLTKRNFVDLEPNSNAKRQRAVAQKDFVNEVDNAPEYTEYLTDKAKDLKAEQAARIQSSLVQIKGYKNAGLRLDGEMRDVNETIIKIDNKETAPYIPPHLDPRRLAHSNVVSPYEAMATKILGMSRIQENCFGCENGFGMAFIGEKIMEHFEKFVFDTFMQVDMIKAACQSEEYYNKYVRHSVDPLDDKGALPEWSKRDIYDHMQLHQPHEQIKRRWEQHRIEEMQNIMYNSGIFTVDSEIMKVAHRAADITDIQVDYKAIEIYLKLSARREKLASGDAKKYLFKNDRISLDVVQAPMAKKATLRQLDLPSIFKNQNG